jgi:hypothetical protein
MQQAIQDTTRSGTVSQDGKGPEQHRQGGIVQSKEPGLVRQLPHARGGSAPEAPRAGSSLPPWDRPPEHSACGQSCGA